MTVPSEQSRNDFVGNGVADTFAYNFRIFLKTDLLVTTADLDGVETTLAVDIDYTVAGVGDVSGGSITLTAGALTTGFLLTIRLVLAVTQNTDIRNQGAYLPETIEDSFDRDVKIIQGMKDEVNRSLKVSETIIAANVSTILPAPKANNFFRWNAAADAIENALLGAVGTVILPGGNGMVVFTTPDTFTNRSIVAGDGSIAVTNGDGQAGNPSIIIPAGGVGTTQISASIAGDGLTGGAGSALDVQPDVTTGATVAPVSVVADGVGVTVDDATIKHTTGTLRVPTDGIGPVQLDRNATYDFTGGSLDVVTQSLGNDTTKVATTAFVQQEKTLVRAAVESTQQTVGDSTTETTIFSKTITGGTIGTDGVLLFKAIIAVREDSGGAPTITFRLKFGGTTIATIAAVGAGVSAHVALAVSAAIANLNSTSSQRGELVATGAVSGDTIARDGAAAVDTTVNQTLVLTAQWSGLPGAATSIRMEYATVFVIK